MTNVATTVARHALVGLSRVSDTTGTPREIAIILLCHEAEQTIRGLADALGAPKSICSRTVSALTARGVLVKREDPKDGRNVFVTLGPLGMAIVSQVSRITAEAIRIATPRGAAA